MCEKVGNYDELSYDEVIGTPDCCSDKESVDNRPIDERPTKDKIDICSDEYNVYGSKLEDVHKIKELENTIIILKKIIADKELEIYRLNERLDDYKSLNRW